MSSKVWQRLGVMFAAAGVATVSLGDVTINEVRIDEPGTDYDEYIELAGTPGESLDGLSYIVIGDGSAVEAVINLDGLSIPSDGYFLAVEDLFGFGDLALSGSPDLVVMRETINFENSDNVTHMLVRDLHPFVDPGTFGGTVVDVDQDGVLDALIDTDGDTVPDAAPWGEIVDSIAVIETIGSGDLLYGPNSVGPDGRYLPTHIYRTPDGNGAWNIGLFTDGSFDTPGTANVPTPGAAALGLLAGVVAVRRRRRA